MDPDNNGATASRLRHAELWSLGLEEGHEPTLESERGVRCLDHVPMNWRAYGEGVDFVGLACFTPTEPQYSVRLGGCALCSPVAVDVDLERRV